MIRFWVRLCIEVDRLRTETDGQDLVEYALITAAIALGLITAVRGIATALISLYTSITASLETVGTPQ
jgi:Flp pilus assembly pilin Flp